VIVWSAVPVFLKSVLAMKLSKSQRPKGRCFPRFNEAQPNEHVTLH
jgi:hypothetical protein